MNVFCCMRITKYWFINMKILKQIVILFGAQQPIEHQGLPAHYSRPLVSRQRYMIIQLVQVWHMVSKSNSHLLFASYARIFVKNQIASQIPRDTGLAPIPYTDGELLPHGVRTSSAFLSTSSTEYALNRKITGPGQKMHVRINEIT